MNILIALLPSIIWGVMPILVNKIGGKPIQQSIAVIPKSWLVWALKARLAIAVC